MNEPSFYFVVSKEKNLSGFIMFYCILCESIFFISIWNRIGGVMDSVLASNAVDRGLKPRSGQKTVKLVFVASPLSMQQ